MKRKILLFFIVMLVSLFLGVSRNASAESIKYENNKVYSNPFKKHPQYKSLKKKNAVFKVKSYTSSDNSVVWINKAKGVMNPGQILTRKEGTAILYCKVEYRRKKLSRKKTKTLKLSVIVESPIRISVNRNTNPMFGRPTFDTESTIEKNTTEMIVGQQIGEDGIAIDIKKRIYNNFYSGDYTTYTFVNQKVDITEALLPYSTYVELCQKYNMKQSFQSDEYLYYVYCEKDSDYTYNKVEVVGVTMESIHGTIEIYAKKCDEPDRAEIELGKSNGYIVIVPIPIKDYSFILHDTNIYSLDDLNQLLSDNGI